MGTTLTCSREFLALRAAVARSCESSFSTFFLAKKCTAASAWYDFTFAISCAFSYRSLLINSVCVVAKESPLFFSFLYCANSARTVGYRQSFSEIKVRECPASSATLVAFIFKIPSFALVRSSLFRGFPSRSRAIASIKSHSMGSCELISSFLFGISFLKMTINTTFQSIHIHAKFLQYFFGLIRTIRYNLRTLHYLSDLRFPHRYMTFYISVRPKWLMRFIHYCARASGAHTRLLLDIIWTAS